MTFGKIGFAAIAFAALVGFGGNTAQAAPFHAGSAVSGDSHVVQAQYHNRGRRMAPPRRICRWETVERRIRGRIVRDRVQKCRMVRR